MMLNSSSRITFTYVSKSELSTQHGWRKLWKMCHRFLWWCHKRDTQWLPVMSLPSDTSSQPVSMPPSLSLSHNSFFLTFGLFLPYSLSFLSIFISPNYLSQFSLSSLYPNSLFLSLSLVLNSLWCIFPFHRFSPTCELGRGGQVRCTACPAGHTGSRCER